MKIICFGVRKYEKNAFKKIETEYKISLELNPEYIGDNNYDLGIGYDVIIVRANCNLSYKSLKILRANGLKYLLTRTVGYNHIDLNSCKELGIKVAYAPGYSPSSIAELGIALALSILRNIPEAIHKSSKYDFRLNDYMFGREIRNCIIGIIGCGRIGTETARLYNMMGASVIGYDVNENKEAKQYLKYVSLNYLIEKSDIISIHMSYNKEINYHFLSKKEFEKMKDNVIIINTARGELIDTNSLIDFVKTKKILGAGLDVIENEGDLFFKKNKKANTKKEIKDLINLYPRVIITPHISSSTESAVYDSMKITINNLMHFINEDEFENKLV